MSIYSKQVKDITFEDIEELLAESAQENIRLEFKESPPKDEKNEMIKKLSSFANTYGGYLVMGAKEDGHGKLVDLPGIDEQTGYAQKIIAWCYQHVYPPIAPVVSPPVPHRSKPDKVFYVIYVPQSGEAPHFLNGRKGCYVRTDEFSQRFEPQLAKYEEIQHLANRRSRAEEERERIIKRAKCRFDAHTQLHSAEAHLAGDIGARFCLGVAPLFPYPPLLNLDRLSEFVQKDRGIQIKRGTFPHDEPQSQHDGLFYRMGDGSYLELEVHGLLFFGTRVTEILSREDIQQNSFAKKPVDPLAILLKLVLYLTYSGRFYEHFGYDGLVRIEVGMSGIKDRKLLKPSSGNRILDSLPGRIREYTSLLDESLDFHLEKSAQVLREETDKIAKEIYETICFACGWRDVKQESDLTEGSVNCAYKTLDLERPQAKS